MKERFVATLLALAVLGGCASTGPRTLDAGVGTDWITPRQAVLLAADAAPAEVEGLFALQVRATGTQGDRTYLNSEIDYRDQRNLTIAITPGATEELARRLGGHPRVVLEGKDILVRGAAVRTKIFFIADGRATDKYYYQTHVNVSDAAQITVR